MKRITGACTLVLCLGLSTQIFGQLIDKNKAPNTSGDGISRPLTGGVYPTQVGSGRHGADWNTSENVIRYDPFRAIRRGRQLFQRKFGRIEGQGSAAGDGFGNIDTDLAIGAGLADSCAACHGRPRGAAGFGGDVVTRPDSRDAPHLFGLGLKEMLADEITTDLRAIRDAALARARATGAPVTSPLSSKGISYGKITALPQGTVDTSLVEGVDADLRVRPFFHHGGTISIREFIVGALKNEMGLAMANDPDLIAAKSGSVTTPSGMVLNGTIDTIEQPPGEEGDLDGNVDGRTALVDFLEFYLLNYFKAGVGKQTPDTKIGRIVFEKVGCAGCHIPNLQIVRDRRVADVNTQFDPVRGNFNRIFATARLLLANPSSIGHAEIEKIPARQPFMVENIYSDLKRHDVGPDFYERNYDGTMRTQFLTTPLWGAGNSGPYGHDGRSISLTEVILRHGGEAQAARDAFARLAPPLQSTVVSLLNSLIVFPPDDTASNLDPGDRAGAGFPQTGHGSIRLSVLFNDPSIAE
jgi:mono/diheme cytochrome c family protein